MKTQHLLRMSLRSPLLVQPRSLAMLLATLALGACSAPPPPAPAVASASAVNIEQQAGDPVIAAVGDIADCSYDRGKKAEKTAELEAYRADLILNGHEHNYERFALQTMKGVADPQRGIREIVIGTGGTMIYPLKEPFVKNSEKRLSGPKDHGVLFLTLHRNGYSWDFRNTDHQSLDQSQQPQACHPKPKDEN